MLILYYADLNDYYLAQVSIRTHFSYTISSVLSPFSVFLKKRMLQCHFACHSFCWIFLEKACHPRNGVLAQFGWEMKETFGLFGLSNCFFQALNVERRLTDQKFVGQNSKAPHIASCVKVDLPKNFRRDKLQSSG